MPSKTHNFIAEKLVEVVEDKHRRQRMMVNTLTTLGLVFLLTFSLYNFKNQNNILGGILAFFSVAAFANIYVLNRCRSAGLIGLTTIIYSLGIILVVSGGYQNTGTHWIYPLAVIAIFINHFRQGLLLSIAFIGTLVTLLANGWVVASYSDVVSVRFIITLFALSGMCHILIYFQSKSDDYILKMHEEDIHKIAYFDGLTQLANRSTFRSILELNKGRKPLWRSALIYIDLDNFKQINDEYGHDHGDKVLSDFSRHLKRIAQYHIGEELGQYDIARLGGDEFSIFIENTPKGDDRARALADDVLALFPNNSLSSLAGVSSSLSASIGIVYTSNEHSNLHESLKLADQTMYEVKKTLKGQVRVVEYS